MSNPENQQTLTPQAVRQHLLNEIEASRQEIESFSDEELASIAGGDLGPVAKGILTVASVVGASAGVTSVAIQSTKLHNKH